MVEFDRSAYFARRPHHAISGCLGQSAIRRILRIRETKFADLFVRIGEPVQFFVRQDAKAKQNFFRHDLESSQLQAIYLQPDLPRSTTP